MIVTRGFSKQGTSQGGVISVHGFGRIRRTILRMRVRTREYQRKVDAQVEGREV